MVEVVEIRAPLPAESAHPDVRHGTRLGVSSCCCGAGTTRSRCGVCDAVSAVTYAHASPVVEYVTPARTVASCAAPVTTITVASTVFPTATVPITPLLQSIDKVADIPVEAQRRRQRERLRDEGQVRQRVRLPSHACNRCVYWREARIGVLVTAMWAMVALLLSVVVMMLVCS